MALSTELLKRLNTDEDPLPKRLKLAENAFHTVDLPIVRKEDLILQWLCDTCTIDQNVWSSLKCCLKTEHFDVKANAKKKLIDAIVNKLNGDPNDVYADVLECCRLLISNAVMQQYLISKPKDLGVLVQSLLHFVHKLLKQTFNIKKQLFEGMDIALINDTGGLVSLAYNTTVSIIESVMQIFKSSIITKDELRIIFIKDILYPLCAIIDHKCTDNTNRLGAIAHKCVQQLIFGKRYVHTKASIKAEESIRFRDLLLTLRGNINTKDLSSNQMTLSFVFRAAIGTYKTDSAALDLIFRELVESAGVYTKEVLLSFLKYLNDITFDFDNKVNNVTLFEYCQEIINTILLSDSMIRIDYELLAQLSYFNPLVIEKKIQDILRKVFVQKLTSEYAKLINAIMDATIRLRREDKLISQILIAIKHTSNHMHTKEIDEFFPDEFKDKFIKAVNGVTNSQGVAMLRTLMFHLNTDCMEVVKSKDSCKNRVIVQATVELLVAVLEGVCIFEYIGTLASHKKLISVLNDLGDILSLLIDKALHLDHNSKIIVIILTAVSAWCEAHSALKYYMPKAITEDLKFPISEHHWERLVQNTTNAVNENCKNSMNKLILHQLKVAPTTKNKSRIKLNSLIGGLDYFWSSVLKYNTEIIPLLGIKEIGKVTQLLLADMTSSEESFAQWVEILNKDCLQESRIFATSLLVSVLLQIGYLTMEGMTNTLTKHLDIKSLIETETIGNTKISKTIITMKEELTKNEWVKIDTTVSKKIYILLKALLYVPLMFLNTNVRLITFMCVYAIMKECDHNEKIVTLCNSIFADLLEKSGFDILQYTNPLSIIEQLRQNKIFQKALEQSFRSNLSCVVLKDLVKSSACCKDTAFLLLECMENVKYKLNVEQKLILTKAERKLSKHLMTLLPMEITEVSDLKALTLVLRISITNKKVGEDVKNMTELTLRKIFLSNNNSDDKTMHELLEKGLHLAVLVLRSQKTFEVSNETIKLIWSAMFNCPRKELLLPLLESSGPKDFQELLQSLHARMANNLSQMRDDALENIFVIWSAILKTDMSAERSKLRLAMINKLLQTVQIVQIPESCWLSLLKLLQSILDAKHLHLPGNIVDIIIILASRSLEEVGISACNDALMICGILVKARASLITDRLPALLLLYKNILKVFLPISKSVIDKSEEYRLRCLALDIEKFTSLLIKLKKDMVRLSPYLIADLMELFSEGSIAVFVKVSIQNCMGQLISICDQHGIALLSRTLPLPLQELFKTQLDAFHKFYKFSGKI